MVPKDKNSNLQNNIELNGIKTMSHNSSTSKTSDQRMRRRRRNPFHHVNRFQTIAAITPERIIGKEIYCSTTVLDTVLAIPNPPIIHLAIKNATKLKNAAHITAWNGVRTLVDTMVAIELAAS